MSKRLNGFTPRPLNTTGREIRRIDPSIEARSPPNVVLESTVHLYATMAPKGRNHPSRGEFYLMRAMGPYNARVVRG